MSVQKYRLEDKLNKYGLLPSQYDNMLKQQNNVCKICLRPETKIYKKTGKVMSLSVDHVHDETKRVRGLLCGRCNMVLGALKDSPELARECARYLENAEETNDYVESYYKNRKQIMEEVIKFYRHPGKAPFQMCINDKANLEILAKEYNLHIDTIKRYINYKNKEKI